MWLFRNKIKKEDPDTSNDVAGKIALAVLKIQQYFSEFMNRLFRKMSNRKLKMLMILFCLAAGSYSGYLIVRAIKYPVNVVDVLKVEPIKASPQIIKAGAIGEKKFRDEVGILKFMDSLKQNNFYQYDSILQARPGLMDSVQVLKANLQP